MILKGNKNQRTQGDVNFEKISFEPKSLKQIKAKNNYFILAEGEHTGNFHGIKKQENIELYEYYDNELQEKCLLLKILDRQAKANPKHQEHKSFIDDLDIGNYRIIQTHEYDHFEEEIRRVSD